MTKQELTAALVGELVAMGYKVTFHAKSRAPLGHCDVFGKDVAVKWLETEATGDSYIETLAHEYCHAILADDVTDNRVGDARGVVEKWLRTKKGKRPLRSAFLVAADELQTEQTAYGLLASRLGTNWPPAERMAFVRRANKNVMSYILPMHGISAAHHWRSYPASFVTEEDMRDPSVLIRALQAR